MARSVRRTFRWIHGEQGQLEQALIRSYLDTGVDLPERSVDCPGVAQVF